MAYDARPEFGELFTDKKVEEYYTTAFKDSQTFMSEEREEWKILYDGYWGQTLAKKDREWLEATNRPPVSLNLAVGTINAILGADQSERKEVQWKGVDLDVLDKAQAEILTRVVRHYFARSDGYRHEADAILDLLIAGYGWSQNFMDTSRIPTPPTMKSAPIYEMYRDPNAVESGLVDAAHVIRLKRWALEQAQGRWPDHREELRGAVRANDVGPEMSPTVTTREGDWSARDMGVGKHGVWIAEFQYIRHEPRVIFLDPVSQRRVDEPKRDFERRKKAMSAVAQDVGERLDALQGMDDEDSLREQHQLLDQASRLNPDLITYHEFAAKKFYRAFINTDQGGTRAAVLEHSEMEGANRFSYTCATGYKRRDIESGRVRFFGPMRTLFDTQLYVNRSASVIIDILARGSKGGGFVEMGAIVGSADEFQKQRGTPGGWTIVKDGALAQGKIENDPSQAMPAGFESFLNLMVDMMGRISLVSEALKGTSDTERSNVLMTNYQQQNLTALNPLFDGIAQMRINNGMAMADLVLNFVSAEDINRIIGRMELEGITCLTVPEPVMGPDGQPVIDPMTGQPAVQERKIYAGDQGAPPQLKTPADLVKGLDPRDFDVVADLGSASPTHRQAVWQVLYQTNLLPQLIELLGPAAQAIVPELIRYLPVPAEWAKKLGDTLETAMKQMPPPQQPGAAPGGGAPQPQQPPQPKGGNQSE